MKKLMILLAVCLFATAVFAASPAKPGKWEMTMQTEMTGMPMKMPAHTFTYCLTKEDVEKSDRLVPEQQRKNSDCKRTDFAVNGNTVSWKVTCEKSKATGEGKITYSGNAYEGSMHMTMPNGEINSKYSGKYLGPSCEK